METLRHIVPQENCDVMGHMNTRHYAGLFDDAVTYFFTMLGHFPRAGSPGLGWADVRNIIEFRREVASGAPILVRTRVTDIGTKSMTVSHEMLTADDGILRATMDCRIVCFDLAARRAVPIPDSFRNAVGWKS